MVDEVGRAWCPLLACVVHRAVGSSRVSGLSEAAASVGRPAVELLKERDVGMWGGVVLCRCEVESGWLVDRSSWALLGGEDAPYAGRQQKLGRKQLGQRPKACQRAKTAVGDWNTM